jgi:hypothetical protein
MFSSEFNPKNGFDLVQALSNRVLISALKHGLNQGSPSVGPRHGCGNHFYAKHTFPRHLTIFQTTLYIDRTHVPGKCILGSMSVQMLWARPQHFEF